MKKQIITTFIIIFSIFGAGSASISYIFLDATVSLKNLVKLHEIEDIRQNLNLRVQKIQSYVHLPASAFANKFDEIIGNMEHLQKAAQRCNSCHHQASVKSQLNTTQNLINDFQKSLSSLMSAKANTAWYSKNQQRTARLADSIIGHVQKMVNEASTTLHRKTYEAMKNINRVYGFLALTLLVTSLLALISVRSLIKQINGPIEELEKATQRIASGELEYHANYKGSEEFEALLDNFNKMSNVLAQKDRENARLYKDLENKINKLHATQHQLITAEKLASLGRLAGGISHDFNNILCGVIGYIGLLKIDEAGNITKEQQKILHTIEDALYQASNLVKNLQTFANQKDWQMAPVLLNEEIKAVTQDLGQKLPAKVKLHQALAEDLYMVMGDPARFRELITAICKNAVQACNEEDGLIEIVTNNFELSLDRHEKDIISLPAGKYARISISDNGSGIPGHILPKIYDPYFSTKDKGAQRGMGLAMAIAYTIVSKHEGHIEINSLEGKGTTVNVYLPATG